LVLFFKKELLPSAGAKSIPCVKQRTRTTGIEGGYLLSITGLFRFALSLGVAASALASTAYAQNTVKLPPMSTQTARYFKSHPAEYAALINRIASQAQHAGAIARFTTTAGGTWTNVKAGPKNAGFCNPLLLTDGTVMVASCDTKSWFKLTPDQAGNYATGTWSKLADLPVIGGTQYAPLYHASAVLPDGRVIIMGGEYNGPQSVWTNLGAIYDPLANAWTPVSAPLGTQWAQIGDAQSIVLTNGQFMLATCCAYHPTADALFNPKTLGWTEVAGPRFGGQYQDEQGYTLLPSGDVLTVDIWTSSILGGPASRNTEIYMPQKASWLRGPQTPVSMPDQDVCGTFEIGPSALRGDGTVVQFGANTGCAAGGSPIDPTAVLDTHTRQWAQGPNVPSVCGADGATACTLADAPAAVMPDGNLLFAASSGYGNAPTHFFEYSPTNRITQVSDPLENSTGEGSYSYFFLDLPNGQVLVTDFSNQMEVYTPAGQPIAAYAPIVYAAPDKVKAGGTYKLVGAQLGGRTAGAYYGDDAQMETNYPIVRFTNVATGDVVYARTTDLSNYSVAPKALGEAKFTVPSTIETGSSLMEIVANGAASKPSIVTVE
jgi:hypothetical protein